jgi:subtilisin family serine protease
MPATGRSALFLAAVLLSFTLSAEDLQLIPLDPAASASAEVDVIIELTEPPLLARRQERVATAMSAVDAQLARLASDIDRIEGRDRQIAANTAAASPLRFQYRQTFAGASARVARESIAAVRALPYVKAVHSDVKMEAHLVKSVPHIRAPQVWQDHGVRGRGVVIAVIDTGIDYTHRALGRGFGPGFKVIGGYDFVNGDADPKDDNGHGTHVAGIAAGNVAPVMGVAPEAMLLAYKVLDDQGDGNASIILAGIERAIDPDGNGDTSDRADVINMSLGGPRLSDDPLIDAIERATAAGTVVSLSAGNSVYNGAIGSPGAAPSGITVAATADDDARAYFSSRGPVGGTWLAKPEVGAPGVDIVSAGLGSGTVSASGTSMAAPHVAGVAALILEKHPDWKPQDVKAAIVSTGRPAFFEQDKSRQSVVAAGGGRIDARSAIDASILPSPATLSFGVVMKRGTPFSATRTVTLTNRGGAAETVTINAPALPAGMTLTAEPATVTIPKDGSAEIELTLSLAAAMPPPNEDDIALAGHVELTTSKSALRLPWLAINGGVLVATFGGDQPVSVLLTARSTPIFPFPTGPRAAGIFVAEPVEVVGYFEAAAGDLRRMVVREQVPVDGYTAITVSPEEAKYRVEFAGADERGIPFAQLTAAGEAWSAIQQHFILYDSSLISLPSLTGVPGATGDRALRVSPMTETIFRAVEVVGTKDRRYATMYPLLRGMQKDEKLEIRPQEWASQTIQHRCDTPQCKVWFAPGAGSFQLYKWYEAATGPGAWRIFLTPRVAEQYDFRAYVVVQEEGFVRQPGRDPWNYLSPPFRNDGGRMAASPFGRATPSADYFSPSPHTPVRLGIGPPVLRTGIGRWRIDVEPLGATLGETLGDDGAGLEVSLFDDATGAAAALWPTESPLVFLRERDEKPYRAELTLPYELEGQNGRLSQTIRWDSTKNASGPTVTMLRVEDGTGMLSNTVLTSSRSRLVFSGRDTATFQGASVVHRFLDSAATRAWWRPHGSGAEWRPLEVAETGSDYAHRGNWPGSPGTFFAANLLPATAATGAIDIKVLIANHWGASSEVTWEPLFFVREGEAKRRSVR